MARVQRLVFGEAAELYDRARPSYPAELVEEVLSLPDRPPAWMVDAGCGTGKAAALFAAAGVAGVGVEPHPAMAEVARRRLGPGWRVDLSPFESWTPSAGDPPVGLIVSAQAWHWFDPQQRFGTAHRLLQPGGWLALWWNRPAAAEDPIQRAIEAVYAAHEPELASHAFGPPIEADPTAYPGTIPDGVAFGPAHLRSYRWSRTFAAAEWLDYLRTQSDHRMLAEDRREALLAAVGRAIEDHGGRYLQPYVCVLWAAERLSVPA